MREAEWEIASHGLKWIDYKDFSYADEHAHMREAIRMHTEATGERPLGWYTGTHFAATLKLVLDDGGFLYSSDSYADDLPYWVNGPKGAAPHHPLHARCQRHALHQPARLSEGEAFFAYLRDSFDLLYEEGAVAPKMMSVGLHCRLAGRPGRAAGLKRFLDHIGRFDRVWIADAARDRATLAPRASGAWRRRSGAPEQAVGDGAVPSRRSQAAWSARTFAAALGDVMEHSPWIAGRLMCKRPFATMAALYQAMVEAVRDAGAERQGTLIKSHPDLAGKAAREGKLTADSAARADERRPRSPVRGRIRGFPPAQRGLSGEIRHAVHRLRARHGKESILRLFETAPAATMRQGSRKRRLSEILRIAALRLDQRVTAPDRLKVHGQLVDPCARYPSAAIPRAGVAVELCEVATSGRDTPDQARRYQCGRPHRSAAVAGAPVPIATYELRFAVSD